MFPSSHGRPPHSLPPSGMATSPPVSPFVSSSHLYTQCVYSLLMHLTFTFHSPLSSTPSFPHGSDHYRSSTTATAFLVLASACPWLSPPFSKTTTSQQPCALSILGIPICTVENEGIWRWNQTWATYLYSLAAGSMLLLCAVGRNLDSFMPGSLICFALTWLFCASASGLNAGTVMGWCWRWML